MSDTLNIAETAMKRVTKELIDRLELESASIAHNSKCDA